MRITLVGGGSGGPVTPLLALVESLADRGVDASYLWFGLAAGPERQLCRSFFGLHYVTLPSFRLHRFWTWRNFVEPFSLLWSLPKAIYWLLRFRPQVVVSAGSFLAVPVGLAAWLLRIPHLLHQQDVRSSLTNRLLVPLASRVSVVFERSLAGFPAYKVVCTGNPRRRLLREMSRQMQVMEGKSSLPPFSKGVRIPLSFAEATDGRPAPLSEGGIPLALITGGGTGASSLNELLWRALPSLLPHCRVVHLTGVGKGRAVTLADYQERYEQREFADHQVMLDLMQQATLVVSRAGLATLTELAALAKPAIIVPIPDSHQVANASYLAERGAAVRIDQSQGAAALASAVVDLLNSPTSQQALGLRLAELLPDGTGAFTEAVVILMKNRK